MTFKLSKTWETPHSVNYIITTKPYTPEIDSLHKDAELPSRPFLVNQCHSARVIRTNQSPDQADGVYTDKVNDVIGIVTADCLPLLLTNEEGTEIAALHGGWRGLAGGIIDNGLGYFHSPLSQIKVYLGPAIGQDNYEIGPEVRKAFLDRYPSTDKAFHPSEKEGHYYLSLTKAATSILHTLGVDQIYNENLCTYEDSVRFYSYRREGKTGRMASLIWLSNPSSSYSFEAAE
ncbi:peptidoglycan editing factor PgeF [Spirochaeta cellobiosiphila]|uniref:peptidoglycan editing factor PgeF n=1 Tax=Spirochaeta cellobiosiphila TaxID=504483 RepID=UPI00042A6154|nr:peptidoglycan editing factor PgeF [Spirochaeta cellobiosiphila]